MVPFYISEDSSFTTIAIAISIAGEETSIPDFAFTLVPFSPSILQDCIPYPRRVHQSLAAIGILFHCGPSLQRNVQAAHISLCAAC